MDKSSWTYGTTKWIIKNVEILPVRKLKLIWRKFFLVCTVISPIKRKEKEWFSYMKIMYLWMLTDWESVGNWRTGFTAELPGIRSRVADPDPNAQKNRIRIQTLRKTGIGSDKKHRIRILTSIKTGSTSHRQERPHPKIVKNIGSGSDRQETSDLDSIGRKHRIRMSKKQRIRIRPSSNNGSGSDCQIKTDPDPIVKKHRIRIRTSKNNAPGSHRWKTPDSDTTVKEIGSGSNRQETPSSW